MSFYQKYNWILMLSGPDVSSVQLLDLNNLLNVRMLNIIVGAPNNGKVSVKLMPAVSELNPYAFKRPIDNLDFGDYFKNEFTVSNPTAFLICSELYIFMRAVNYIKYLKAHYPDAKFVFYFTNPVHYYQRLGLFTDVKDLEELKSEFDLVTTYCKFDSVYFGLTYANNGYSILPLENREEIYDIFFVGAAKDRLDKIHSYYKYFKENGFKCNFYISGVPPEKQKYPGEIHYNQWVSYLDNLIYVLRSKGVLEVSQKDNRGLTMRFFEALVYDKNFITDNGFFYQDKFLSSPKLFYIPPYSKLNIDREKFLAVSKLSNNYKGEYSPVRYLEFLEAYFNSRR